MRVDEFDYELPAERIAQHPASPRGSSRLMVLDRARGSWQHAEFHRLAEELRPGDLDRAREVNRAQGPLRPQLNVPAIPRPIRR